MGMKAQEILDESAEGVTEVAVNFPPSTILVFGAEGVTTGVLVVMPGGVSLRYMHPKGTVGGDSRVMMQPIGSEWVSDSIGFEIANS